MVAVDPNTRQQVIDEYVAGSPITLLSKKYNFGTTTIHRWVKKAGVARTQSETKQLINYPQEFKDRCVKEYGEGKPTTQIERENKGYVCADTVMKWVKEAGINRSHGTTKRLKRIDQKWECIDLYLSGLSIPQVSQRTGKHWTVIHTWLKEEGVNRSRKEGNMKVIRRNIQEDVMRDYDKGILTLEQIGDKYGISGASINRFISTTTNKRDMSYRKLLFVKRGPHSHNWRGGKKNSKYCHKFDNSLRERVRAWWGYQCAICGKTQEENKYRLDVHHVNYDKMVCCNDKPRHFAPLCAACHSKSGGSDENRQNWETMLESIIIARYNGRCFYTKEEFRELTGELWW